MQVGDVCRFNYQSDIYQRQYKIVALEPGGMAEIELLPIEDEVLDKMILDEYTSEQMILDDIARTGSRMKIKFVSAAAWAEMF